MSQYYKQVTFKEAKVAILSNVDPTPSRDTTQLKQRLIAQMTGSVRWREIMEQLERQEVTKAIEVGPGKVLSGLIKRACQNIELVNIGTLEQLDKVA